MSFIVDVMNYLIDHRPHSLPAEGLADVFDDMFWCVETDAQQAMQQARPFIVQSRGCHCAGNGIA